MSEINKKGFIELVQVELGGTKKEAEAAINAYHKAVGKALATPDTKIALQGAFTLTSEMTAERQMVNQLSPTKDVITVPAKLKLKCKVSPSIVK